MYAIFSRFRNLISTLSRARIVVIIFSLILLAAIPLTVFVAQQQQQTKQHASFISPAATFSSFTKDYQQLILEKLIDPATQILEVGLSYDESKDPQVSFLDARILNGYVPYQFANLRPNTYTLQELDQNSLVLYRTKFEIPNDIHVDPNPDGTITAPVHTKLKRVSFIQTIPYYSKANSILIHDPQGKIIAVKFLKDTPRTDNKPNFKLINGADIIQLQKTNIKNPGMGVPKLNINNLIPVLNKVFAQEEKKRKINIAFIGDGAHNYEKDVQAASDYLFTLEPFHTRASQFNITYINSDSYIDCTPINCDVSGLVKEANDKGLPYDMITTIVPDRRAFNGVIGATVVYRTDDKYSPPAWAHEMGHVLGHLHDEYVSDNIASLDPFFRAKITIGQAPLENCYGGTPPSSDWANLVGIGDYNKGCTSLSFYSPSPISIMSDYYNSAQNYYNAVSQKIINEKLDEIVGSFTENKISPQVSFMSPDSSITLSKGSITVKAQATDDRGVAYVQLWVDGVFLKTSYVAPYDFIWNTSSEKDGPHTLQLKAYDASGNVGNTDVRSIILKGEFVPLSKITLGGDLQDGMTVSNSTAVVVIIASIDKKRIQRIETFVDGQISQAMSSDQLEALFARQRHGFFIDPRMYATGKHDFYAKAYDYMGNTTTSNTIIFKVVNNSPILSPAPLPLGKDSQEIKVIPPEPAPTARKQRERGIISGKVFLDKYVVNDSSRKISCQMIVFLQDSMGNEIERLFIPIASDMGIKDYKFDNLDIHKDYSVKPRFYGCDGRAYANFFNSKTDFNNLMYTSFGDIIIAYLSDVVTPIPTVTLTPQLTAAPISISPIISLPAPNITCSNLPQCGQATCVTASVCGSACPSEQFQCLSVGSIYCCKAPAPSSVSIVQANTCPVSLTKADANCDGKVDVNDFNRQRDYAIGGQITWEALTLWTNSVWGPAFSSQ